jgi:Ca2+-dependent lipid-binding protein
VGGKPIGQTAVIPSTLSPVWNHTFEIELLHLETPILLELFDEDDMKVDEALGRAEVVLKDLPLDSVVEQRLPLQDVGQITAKGQVKISLTIKVFISVVLFFMIIVLLTLMLLSVWLSVV